MQGERGELGFGAFTPPRVHGGGQEVEAAELLSSCFAWVSPVMWERPVSGLSEVSVSLFSLPPVGCAVLRGGGETLRDSRDNFDNRLPSSTFCSATARDEKELGRLL